MSDRISMMCTVCDKVMNRNHWELNRHWETHNKERLDQGEKADWKMVIQ